MQAHFYKQWSTPTIWLFIICLFNLIYFVAEHEGLYFYDDYSYSLYAHKITTGSFKLDGTVWVHRLMVFLPTAFFYALFGANPYSTTLWPLLSTLTTYFLIWFTFRKQYPTATAWMLVLLGLYYFLLNTINFLYPDNIALLFNTAVLLILYKIREPLPVTKGLIWGFLFAFLNFLYFLTKETILYTLPFYFLFFSIQLYNRRNLFFWLSAGSFGFILLASYLFAYHFFTGDIFLRIHDIEAYSQLLKTDYLAIYPKVILARLTYQPFLFFISSGLAIPLAFAATLLFTIKNHRFNNLQEPLTFWLAVSLSMLATIWFGSVSFDHYKPMTLLPRMFLPLVLPFCIVGGLAITETWGKHSPQLFLALLFLICTILAPNAMKVMYAPLALFFILNYLLKLRFSLSHALVVTAFALSIRPLYFIWKPSVSNYFAQAAIVQKHLQHKAGKYVVFTDRVLSEMHPFMYGFASPENYTFKEFKQAENLTVLKADTVYLLINNGTLENAEHGISIRERDILSQFPKAKLLTEKDKVKLFAVPKVK